MKHIKNRTLALLVLIIAGETIFFLPFVLVRIFRPTLLMVFEISNVELGSYFSIYGVVAVVAYLFGGPLADKYPARNLMSSALCLTGLGGFVMATIPANSMMKVLYAFWGFTTILLFWAALIKATRQWGGEDFQGRAFGWLEGGRGLTAALMGTFSLLFFSAFMPESSEELITTERSSAFTNVILSVSVFTLFSGLLVYLFIPNTKQITEAKHAFSLKKATLLLANPKIWLLAVIIVCAYIGYKITDDFSLYAKEVLNFNEVEAAGVGTAALWMRALVAVLAGYLADRVNAVKVISWSFVITIAGGLGIGLGIIEHIVFIAILNLGVVMIGIYGVRALYFALIQEANIPVFFTGTAVGIVSIIGFTPDIFMSPWMGYLLDNNPGPAGHQNVFLLLAVFACLGFIASLMFVRSSRRVRSIDY